LPFFLFLPFSAVVILSSMLPAVFFVNCESVLGSGSQVMDSDLVVTIKFGELLGYYLDWQIFELERHCRNPLAEAWSV
jgi:hypothetical protein